MQLAWFPAARSITSISIENKNKKKYIFAIFNSEFEFLFDPSTILFLFSSLSFFIIHHSSLIFVRTQILKYLHLN